MRYNPLGRTGLSVSEICLGTMTWGSQNSEAEAFEQMDYAVSQGVNFFDTAELYPTTPASPETYGDTETIIGNWFEKTGRRQDVILASKVAGPGRAYIRDGRPTDAESIRTALDASLKRLKTDYIDLYQIHWPNRPHYHFRNSWSFDAFQQDRETAKRDIETILTALGEAVKAGKIRHVGLSNETAWGTLHYIRLSEEKGLPRVASIQNEYNLLYRTFDLDLAEVARHEDVGLLPYSPLAAGLLTGKYLDGARPQGARASFNKDLGGRLQPLQEPAVKAYRALAERHGLDLARLSLAFVLSRPFTTSVIVGATTLDQLKNDIAAKDLSLTEDILKDIAAVHRQYPLPI